MKLSEAQISFVGCLLVSLTDTMGLFFTAPVMVPYGQQLNATSSEIGGFATVFYIFGMFSLFWMPLLADAKGARIVMIVSVLGTALSYALQGNSHHFMPMDPKGGVWAMMAGDLCSSFCLGKLGLEIQIACQISCILSTGFGTVEAVTAAIGAGWVVLPAAVAVAMGSLAGVTVGAVVAAAVAVRAWWVIVVAVIVVGVAVLVYIAILVCVSTQMWQDGPLPDSSAAACPSSAPTLLTSRSRTCPFSSP